MPKHVYSWKPDLPDHRDHLFIRRFGVAAPLPPKVDLRPKLSPVEDQGQLGSCTANAIAGALEYLERMNGNGTFFDVSRLFTYYQERVIEGTVKQDAGAEIRDGVKSCAKVGYCDETLWPYKVSKFAVKPPKAAYTDAAKHKIASYRRADTIDDFRTAIAAGDPVVFGFSVYESFESAKVAKTGVVPMPTKKEKLLGGHAVLMVGYDDTAKRVIVRNSWGPGWGQKGYFTMPYAYVSDRNYSDDFWIIYK